MIKRDKVHKLIRYQYIDETIKKIRGMQTKEEHCELIPMSKCVQRMETYTQVLPQASMDGRWMNDWKMGEWMDFTIIMVLGYFLGSQDRL